MEARVYKDVSNFPRFWGACKEHPYSALMFDDETGYYYCHVCGKYLDIKKEGYEPSDKKDNLLTRYFKQEADKYGFLDQVEIKEYIPEDNNIQYEIKILRLGEISKILVNQNADIRNLTKHDIAYIQKALKDHRIYLIEFGYL